MARDLLSLLLMFAQIFILPSFIVDARIPQEAL